MNGPSTIRSLFAQIFIAAAATQHTPSPVRFLSRYDKSANNIRESAIWTSIGQTPWSEPYSHWYHRFVAFPVAALQAASVLGEYTLVDRGTWYAVREEDRKGLKSYVSTSLDL
jgi:ABC-type tungstate transport system permease subunit